MLEQMKQAHENSFDKFSNGGRLSKAPFGRVIVLQWKVNDNFWIFSNIVHIQYIYELCTNLIFMDIQKESKDWNGIYIHL